MLPGRFSLKQIIFLLLINIPSFLVCGELLMGIVYPLAVIAHNALDLVHQKRASSSGAARPSSSPFVGALSLCLYYSIYVTLLE